MNEEIDIEAIRKAYADIASKPTSFHINGRIMHGGKHFGDFTPGHRPFFEALGGAANIILSLCNTITYNNEIIDKQRIAYDKLKSSNEVAEKKMLRKVADAQSQ